MCIYKYTVFLNKQSLHIRSRPRNGRWTEKRIQEKVKKVKQDTF